MAQPARKHVISTDFVERVQSALAPAHGDSAPVASPARMLQDQLAHAFASPLPEPHVEKYPPAVRLLVLSSLTIGCWGGLIAGGRLLLGHLTAHG